MKKLTPNTKVGITAGAAAVLALAGALVTHWEGKRNLPYRDVVGVLTVCYGHTRGVEDRPYSDAECDALQAADLADAYRTVQRCVPRAMPLTVAAALTDLVFNVGPQGVCGSTIQKLALDGDWPGVCAQLPRWNLAGGAPNQGVTNRRFDDTQVCLNGLAP